MTKRLDRELSWINYNSRVLEEGLRKDLPPLERFRFLSIVSSNFDEFFMVRIAGLKRVLTAENGDEKTRRILEDASKMIRSCYAKIYHCLEKELFPALSEGGLELRRPPFTPDETGYLKSLFMQEILPVLTPLRFGPIEDTKKNPPPPDVMPAIITSGILHGAFLLERAAGPNPETAEPRLYISIVGIPPILERIIQIEPNSGTVQRWVLLEDLLMLWGDSFFPGYEVKERLLFRIHRDADFSVDEKRDEDFVEAMEEMLVNRDWSRVVRMVYSPWDKEHFQNAAESAASTTIISTMTGHMGLSGEDLFSMPGPLNLGSLISLTNIQGFEKLKLKSPKPLAHPAFPPDIPIWNVIRAGDVLLSLPYQSFDPVIRFFEEAAADPAVISIKTTLYRTSGNSPIIHALEQAVLNGKHVTAVVELKARFDEERNISWANRLEKAGVIVIYGLAQLKIHAKVCQVIRREPEGLAQYLHFSTGNYNDKTARLYSDLSLFTCREDFGSDTALFFNILSGYSAPHSMNNLVMAPLQLKHRLIELIDREAKRSSQGSPGRIMAKMNALVDDDVVDALYRASRAGVLINLNVRGICTLVPATPGLSENIRVVSIVDHFLEHSRIYYFNNGGAEEFFISSADWMPRNLERRVELLVPVPDEEVREELRIILEAYFKDNTQAWILTKNGAWKRRIPEPGEEIFRAQEYLQLRAEKAAEHWKTPQQFIVRRRGNT